MSKDETKQDTGAAAPEDTLTEDPSLTPPAAELPVNPHSGRSERVPSYFARRSDPHLAVPNELCRVLN